MLSAIHPTAIGLSPRVACVIAICGLLTLSTPVLSQTRKPTLRAVPSEALQAESRRALRERLAKDYTDVTQAGKRRLVGILARELQQVPTDADAFVLHMEIRELAIGAGEVDLALQTIGDIAARFEVDADAMRNHVLTSIGRSKLSATQAVVLARAARALAESRLSADDFSAALQAAQLAEDAARRTGDSALQAEFALFADFCRDIAALAPRFTEATRTLQTDPTNVGANTTAGEFLVLVKREWGRGLVLLSRGTDKALAEAAAAELANAPGPQLLAAADTWASWAEKKQGTRRAVALDHARVLYQQSIPGLSGPDLDRALTRVAQLVTSLPTNADLADRFSARTKLGEARWAWWDGLRFTTVSAREDIGELKGSQAIVDWRPRMDRAGEVAELPAPEADTPREPRFAYRLRVLCVDEQKNQAVLERTGKVPLREPDKQIRLPGPLNKDIRRLNAGRIIPLNLHVEFYLDGVKVSERLWKLQNQRAWWLDDTLVQRKGD